MPCGLVFSRFCVEIYGNPWESIEIYGNQWKSMDIHGNASGRAQWNGEVVEGRIQNHDELILVFRPQSPRAPPQGRGVS